MSENKLLMRVVKEEWPDALMLIKVSAEIPASTIFVYRKDSMNTQSLYPYSDCGGKTGSYQMLARCL